MVEAYYDFVPTCEYAQNRDGLEGCAAEYLTGGKLLKDVFPEGIRVLLVCNPFYGPVVVDMRPCFVFCNDSKCLYHGWEDEV